MKTGFKILGIVLYGMLLLAFLAACGGSGDGTGDTIPSFPYKGETAPAVINAANAAALVNSLYHNAKAGSIVMGEVGVAFNFPGETVSGPCGSGNSTNTVDIDPLNFSARGTVTFNSYDNCEAIINGTVSASASLSGTLDPESMTLTMSSLSMTNSSATMAVAGQIAASASGTDTMDITQNLWFDNGGTVSKIVNFNMSIYDNDVDPVEITITSGDFYEPTVGYLSVATGAGSPLVDTGGGMPTAGVLLFTGADGVNGPTGAKLDFSYPTELWVDADGDGNYETSVSITL